MFFIEIDFETNTSAVEFKGFYESNIVVVKSLVCVFVVGEMLVVGVLNGVVLVVYLMFVAGVYVSMYSSN